ncbi:unnamed protein product [Polarella glacialis]|uniref:Bifunctional lysine-specific demethylase and histidyl-hydroxylase n=1 Tax=Polarella glacialis TaxID=89957 RepID=A0A813LAR1_POLGL|nr:unnamed protein product [Polarella glacialis]
MSVAGPKRADARCSGRRVGVSWALLVAAALGIGARAVAAQAGEAARASSSEREDLPNAAGCDLRTLLRDEWRELSPSNFARNYSSQGEPLLLRGALRLDWEEGPEVRQASRWSPAFLRDRVGNRSLDELPRALASKTRGGAVVLEDSTHFKLFAALRPLSPIFPRDGPLAPLRALQMLFVVPPGGSFGYHAYHREDGYTVLLQGPPQLWWFSHTASAVQDELFADLCRNWTDGHAVPRNGIWQNAGNASHQFCIQHPGDAIWVPAGVHHAVCTLSSGEHTAVSAGGRGDMVGWTKAMQAARDGSIPLLQRATNVAALSLNVATEIQKVRKGGPWGTESTAVHLAASRGHTSALEWLLKRVGGSVAAATSGMATDRAAPQPHHFAAAYGHLEALKVLATHGAELRATARLGLQAGTARDIALQAGHADVARWLLQHEGQVTNGGSVEHQGEL